jgi:hypothetical protein
VCKDRRNNEGVGVKGKNGNEDVEKEGKEHIDATMMTDSEDKRGIKIKDETGKWDEKGNVHVTEKNEQKKMCAKKND